MTYTKVQRKSDVIRKADNPQRVIWKIINNQKIKLFREE